MGYPIPRPTELGYYDLSDETSDVRRKQGQLAREYGVDAFAYHHYWFYDEEHPGPNLHKPLELMLLDGEPDVPFCLHWAAMKWVNTWQSSGGKTSKQKQPKDGILQLQYFPDPNEAEGRSRIKEHYKWLSRFFHHKNYIKINGQPLFMLYQKKPMAAPVLEEFRRLAIEDGFSGMYFTVGLTRPHADLQSFFPFRGIQRFKGFDTYNATVAYPNPADWSNRSLTVPEWCAKENAKDGSINQRQSTEIPGIIVSFDNTPRRSFEDARILSDEGSKAVVATFRESLKAAMVYESCCLRSGSAQNEDGFIIVNAWNEWAEGMMLEPSDVYGRQFLETVREVKEEIVRGNCGSSRSSQQNRAFGSHDELLTSSSGRDNLLARSDGVQRKEKAALLCLVVKDQYLRYIDEWADYHMALGFTGLRLYDNTDDFVMKNWGNDKPYRNHIERIHFLPNITHKITEYKMNKTEVTKNQDTAYMDCVQSAMRRGIEWVAAFDEDEFLVLRNSSSVVEFMDEHCKYPCGQISFNTYRFGSANRSRYVQLPVTRRFQYRDSSDDGFWVKAIVNPRAVTMKTDFWFHTFPLKNPWLWKDTSGRIITSRNKRWNMQTNRKNAKKSFDVAVLHHYNTLSVEEFQYKLDVRKGVNGLEIPRVYPDASFFKEFDNTAWQILRVLVPSYQMYDSVEDLGEVQAGRP